MILSLPFTCKRRRFVSGKGHDFTVGVKFIALHIEVCNLADHSGTLHRTAQQTAQTRATQLQKETNSWKRYTHSWKKRQTQLKKKDITLLYFLSRYWKKKSDEIFRKFCIVSFLIGKCFLNAVAQIKHSNPISKIIL